ncbi:hypothetical protein D3C85_1301230 [compost metagenome]
MFDVDVLQVAVAGGCVADALAVHQHQALRRLRATNVNPRQTATPAGLRNLHTRHATQQISDAVRLQAVDVFAGEHGIGGAAVVARFDLAVGADQHVGQFQGLIAFEGVGQQLPGWQQCQRQGEGGEFHGGSGISDATQLPCRSCRRLRSFDFDFSDLGLPKVKIKRSQPSAAPTQGVAFRC